jgi:hypothetical protein
MEQEEKDRILQEREKWYSLLPVKFEICKCLKHREFAILDSKEEKVRHTTRYLLAFSVAYLDKHFQRFEIGKTLRNLYMSVATLKDVPVFSYNLEKRRSDLQYIEFNKNYKNYATGYNLFLDFDLDPNNFEESYKEVLKAFKIFSEYKLPFFCLNSSKKGIHFHIPSEFLPKMEMDKLIEKLNGVIYNLKGIFKLSSLDNSVIDLKRICRLPYSYSCDGSICLPLDDSQIQNFNPEMVKMENVMKNIIRDRGLLTRAWGLSEQQLKENVVKFLKDFES